MLRAIEGVFGATWTDGPLTLYHGTVGSHARDLLSSGIDLNKCRKRGDFSQGFYTTTYRDQAVAFANRRYINENRRDPATFEVAALVMWDIGRTGLGNLDGLVFVRARDNEDYWRFVSYCWGGTRRHKANGGYYDIVWGPVNLDHEHRQFLPNRDQVSFHTSRAVNILEAAPKRHEPGQPRLTE